MSETAAQMALLMMIALPAATGAALSVGGRSVDRLAPMVAITVATLTTVMTGLAAAARPSASTPFMAGTDLALTVDGLAAYILPAVSVVTLLTLVVATAQVRAAPARFHGLMLLFAAAALTTVAAATLPTLLLAWEVMGATSYALIGFQWQQPRRLASGMTAFLATRTGDLGLYVAAGAAVAGGGGLYLGDLVDASHGWRQVIAVGLMVAALGKAAQLPFSFWLSRAMDGPSPVSALLHSAAMVALGGYLLLRVAPVLDATKWVGEATAWFGAVTAVTLGAVAIVQTDLKQLLAASTSAQLGFVVLAAGVGAVTAGASQLVAHAAVKSLLFLVAGVWLSALGTKRLVGLRGVARRWPVIGVLATVGLLSLGGVSPLALWATKESVLSAVRDQSLALYIVGTAGALLSAAYSGVALAFIWRRPRQDTEDWFDEEEPGTRQAPRYVQGALIPLAVGAVALGALALPPLNGSVASSIGETGSGATASTIELIVSGLLAATIMALTILVVKGPFGSRVSLVRDWLSIESIVQRLVVAPTLKVAALGADLDDRILDRGVDRLAVATLRLGTATAAVDQNRVDLFVESAAAQTRRFARLVLRPQTGQVHHYYLQAVGVMGVAALILVLVR